MIGYASRYLSKTPNLLYNYIRLLFTNIFKGVLTRYGHPIFIYLISFCNCYQFQFILFHVTVRVQIVLIGDEPYRGLHWVNHYHYYYFIITIIFNNYYYYFYYYHYYRYYLWYLIRASPLPVVMLDRSLGLVI